MPFKKRPLRLRIRLARAVCAALAIPFAGNSAALAGDLLRGGAPMGSTAGNHAFGANPAALTQARANAQDRLARTTQAVQAVRAMQAAARNLAKVGANNLGLDPNHPGLTLPNVPNGLVLGGLQVAPGGTWQGALAPQQTAANGKTKVAIKQTEQSALLTWTTFNVGKETALTFDQTAGGTRASEWIAFNKITDPSGVPSQILGSISALGQVYVINQNGIIFGGSSQVNTHALVASSLPINDNLVARGLLNNPDNQFLFSALPIAAGNNGPTPAFTPSTPLTPSGKTGDVIVQKGASLSSPTTPDHIGGRVALIGANVTNAGTISTPDGQTILAAGLQVGLVAHATADPSLRGLDVFVGDIGTYAGTATNAGLIENQRAEVTLSGKTVNQLGVIDGTTSVSFNGRVDLLANYNSVSSGGIANTAPFLFQNAGVVSLGEGSVIRILPELASIERVIGQKLALSSKANLQGEAIHFVSNSMLLAPSADVSLDAGNWDYVAGGAPQANFIHSTGQVYLDRNATISVAGSIDVSAPIAENIVPVQLRGAELADALLQRFGPLRGQTIEIDVRQAGIYNGHAWIGTPLADATGYVGLIQRTAGELTTAGGTVKLNAGDSIVMQPGSTVDVSGGWINYQAGIVETTRVLSGGHIFDISQATPDRVYDGIYNGQFTATHLKYGLSETFATPLLSNAHYEMGYTYGGKGGSISITAPSVALDGNLRGNTVSGARQQTIAAAPSAFSLAFEAQVLNSPLYPLYSPTPPKIVFQSNADQVLVGPFALDALGSPITLSQDRKTRVVLLPEITDQDGFGIVNINNADGSIVVAGGVELRGSPITYLNDQGAPQHSSITMSAANIDLEGNIILPGGALSFTVTDFTPFTTAFAVLQSPLSQTPSPDSSRGHFTIGSSVSLNTAGLIVDDRLGSPTAQSDPLVINGGTIIIKSYSANLRAGSTLDVSGGMAISVAGKQSYGNAGSIVIRAGQDPNIQSLIGGQFLLKANLKGYSGATGGSLNILAPLIQIGGSTKSADTLLFSPDFFSHGGFTNFTLVGLGAATNQANQYIPGLVISANTELDPIALNWAVMPGEDDGELRLSPLLKPQGLRTPVSLNFGAVGVRDSFTSSIIARGDLIMKSGAVIHTDPMGSVSLEGDSVAVLGTIIAPGGVITLSGGKDSAVIFPNKLEAVPTVDLGPRAFLSTAGVTVLTPDPRGYRTGSVLPGGSITITGNIVAESGSTLDVSGAGDVLDLSPSYSSIGDFHMQTPGVKIEQDGSNAAGLLIIPSYSSAGVSFPLNGSLNGSLLVPTRVESNGGSVTLNGAQELFTDATLVGKPGGSTALGGRLTISSGRFYPVGGNTLPTLHDVTLVVTQNEASIPASFYPAGQTAIGNPVVDKQGNTIAGLGYFAADRFNQSGFDSLTLKGAVQFSGPVTITALESLVVGDNGFILADPAVDTRIHLSAPYAGLGTLFQSPLPFGELASLANPLNQFPPTYGTGSLTVTADLIDIGNLSLQGIGKAKFIANNGEIRGDGTLDIAGNLTMRAGQIYPATAVSFTIAAYDYQSGGNSHLGSVTFESSGVRQLPLSAGGQLNVYGSVINQGGVLRAPLGTINLGWDGVGSAPTDLLSGISIAPTQQLILAAGSVTSVSAIDPISGQALLIPYGLDLDGKAWIDPTGTDISLSGVPSKAINISAANIDHRNGATIDIRGGGDLFAYRWVTGLGGTKDVLAPYLLDTAGNYALDKSGKRIPTSSFAIIADYHANYAPYAPYNSSSANFGADPGYVSASLSVGDRIYLNASEGLPAGAYTLLPARYALLPGAYLVTPKSGVPAVTTALPDGSNLVAGYRFNTAQAGRPLFASFEVAPQKVVLSRAEYDDFHANRTFASAVNRPADSGKLVLAATQAMSIQGTLLSQAALGGRGSLVDVSSPADVLIAGPQTNVSNFNGLVLQSSELTNFGAASLLIGGVRQSGVRGTTVTVTTNNIIVDNAGESLNGQDIALVANDRLTIAQNAKVTSSGAYASAATLQFGQCNAIGTAVAGSGDGVVLRVSSDASAQIMRSGVDTSGVPEVVIQAGAQLAGTSLILDSTHAMSLDLTASLKGQVISLDSGQISIQLNNPGNLQPTVGLVLSGPALAALQTSAKALSLLSYSSIDIYGTGEVGAATFSSLAFHAGEIRGFNGGPVTFTAQKILLDNSANVAGLGVVPGMIMDGTLAFKAGSILLGANQLSIDQYADVKLDASGGILAQGLGSFATQGNLTMTTPLLTGAKAADEAIGAGGTVIINKPASTSVPTITGGFGSSLTVTGASVTNNGDITLASGTLTLRATSGDLEFGNQSSVDVSGVAQEFFDLTRYTNGGRVSLESAEGNVTIAAGSTLNVAAPVDGGNAGNLSVSAPKGLFTLAGSLSGKGGVGGEAGTFSLDVGSLPNAGALDGILNTGGFTEARTYRVRNGGVVIDGLATSHHYNLSADAGSITVTASGLINASGLAGGTIDLSASASVILLDHSGLTVAAQHFNSAGKGGAISLGAGSEINGSVDGSALLDIQAGSMIDLTVADNTINSAALGNFTGTLHLRAPQTAGASDLQVNEIDGTVVNASSILVEGYNLFDATPGGSIDGQKAKVLSNGQIFGGNTAAISARLLAQNSGLASVLKIKPGAEIINRTGALTLASAWDLSTYRFGPNNQPGYLTLRAAGNINFNFKASLSDGFTSSGFTAPLLPVGNQSWSYNLVAGASFDAADFHYVLPSASLPSAEGSVLLGNNTPNAGFLPSNHSDSRQSIISSYFQTIRTGSGDISISAGRDVQLLNPLATIYTAGVQATSMLNFDLPNLVYKSPQLGPTQGPTYAAQYSLGGGNVTIQAQNDISEVAKSFSGELFPNSSRELPNNWLYRRGHVDPTTGQFDLTHTGGDVASTTWWVDFSNFFEGVGALGGGNVTVTAGHDINNVDAVVPTNARMPKGTPDAGQLLELGGGDLTLHAGHDINGGVYYVEKGQGNLLAGNSIHTNATRAALTQTQIQNIGASGGVPDSSTWLPTTLFLGKGDFKVATTGDLLLGPVVNPFLLPQGINNSFYLKTYFSTYAAGDALNVSSLTGTVTLKESADTGAGSLAAWFQNVLLYYGNPESFSQSQPWLRLAETDITPFASVTSLMPGTLRVTAFSGDIDIVGNLTLSPAPLGTVDLAAAHSLNGLQINGLNTVTNNHVWGSSRINLSDANPGNVPGVASPLSAPARATGLNGGAYSFTFSDLLGGISSLFDESGATLGASTVLQTEQKLHSAGLLHSADHTPIHLYAKAGGISGVTLFSGKATDVIAGTDISDIALYLQNNRVTDVSRVVAGRDIVAYDSNSSLRVEASNSALGNELIGQTAQTPKGQGKGSPNVGDIQISGLGTLEVMAGRNLDLGDGISSSDGTGMGITSIGNARNPYLPFMGADLIAVAGVDATGGLVNSKFDFKNFIAQFVNGPDGSRYLSELGDIETTTSVSDGTSFGLLPMELQEQLSLDVFYLVLRDAGRDHTLPGAMGFGNYTAGSAAISTLLPGGAIQGDILTESRDIRTKSGGNISLLAPGGKLALATSVIGNPLAPPGIVTEDGGNISIFTNNDVNIGISRIFTLRGGNEIIWSSVGNIAAGSSSKTVQSAPPTRVLIDPQSGDVKTDLAGLATGGGIGVLATVIGVPPGNVDLIAPVGTVDAGDAGIRVSGNLNIAASVVLNASNIQAGGASVGVPVPTVVAPNLSGFTAASNTAAAGSSAASEAAKQTHQPAAQEEIPSIITVEVLGYGGG